MASYPNSIYSPREKQNRSGVEYDETKKTVIFAEDIVNDDNEIVAIETELGTNPKGDFSDVKTRLAAGLIRDLTFIIDGGGSAITTGQKGHLEIPFKCEIQQVTLLADQSGSIVIDIWKDTYANFPPTVDDSICGSAKPTLSSAQKYQNSTLTGWTKTINTGDILAFNVDSVATITRITLSLKVKLIP
jgi:hypothetical protein